MPSHAWRALTPIQGERQSRRTVADLHPRAVDAALAEETHYFVGAAEERRALNGGSIDQNMRSLDPAHGHLGDGDAPSDQQTLLRDLSSKLHEIQDQQEQIRQLLANVRAGAAPGIVKSD